MLTILRTCLITVALGCVAIVTASTGCGGGGTTDLFSDTDASMATSGSGGSGGGSADDGGVIIGNTPCGSDKDCTPNGQLCDTARSVCVDCISAKDCKTNEECKGGTCAAFTPCTTSKQCGSDQVCDVGTQRCVECVAQADCKDGQACIDHACRAACTSDKDCRALVQVCDTTQMACVECVASVDCDPKKYCVNHACVDRVCTPASSVCKSGGVATCNAEGSAYGAVSPCPASSPCVEAAGKATCSGQDAGMSVCSDGITVWFLVSRSGAMFSTKFADTTTHWAAVLQAFAAEGPLKDYASKMKIGLATFAGEMTAPACPALMTIASRDRQRGGDSQSAHRCAETDQGRDADDRGLHRGFHDVAGRYSRIEVHRDPRRRRSRSMFRSLHLLRARRAFAGHPELHMPPGSRPRSSDFRIHFSGRARGISSCKTLPMPEPIRVLPTPRPSPTSLSATACSRLAIRPKAARRAPPLTRRLRHLPRSPRLSALRSDRSAVTERSRQDRSISRAPAAASSTLRL